MFISSKLEKNEVFFFVFREKKCKVQELFLWNHGNRDSNMMEILEVINFPKIEYYSNKISLDKDEISFSGNLNFHGISTDLNINSEIKKTNKKLILSGEFNVSLVDHDVKLPTFMLRSIEKEVLIKYQLLFNRSDN